LTIPCGLSLTALGVLIGTVGTMVGVGSGWVHVPFLMLVFGFSPQDAIATSLAVISLNTLAGSLIYSSQGKIDFYFSSKLAYAALPGAIIGPFIVDQYSPTGFNLFFAGFLILLSYYLFVVRDRIFSSSIRFLQRDKMSMRMPTGEVITYSTNIEVGVAGTFVIGFISNLLGIGGGVIHVPFLIVILGVPPHVAVATSHFILFVSSAAGTIVFALMGHVSLNHMMAIGIGTMFGALIGADLSSKSNEKTIRQVLAMVVFVIALKLLYETLFG
jgi:uncharacterized protein